MRAARSVAITCFAASILAIATHCLALAGRREEAQRHAERVRQAVPGYGIDDFLGAFRFAPEAAALYRGSGVLGR